MESKATSGDAVDFMKKAKKQKPNERCSCGSKKKYKKCCSLAHAKAKAEEASSKSVLGALGTAASVQHAMTGGPKHGSQKGVRAGAGGHGATVRSHTSGGNSSR